MRKLTAQERQLLHLINNAGGSICPGVETSIPREGHKSLRRMERAGLLRVEETQDGFRFHLTDAGRAEIDHG
ncbi:hypothetical protein ACFSX5_01115 [Devosia albogilva]|uniref:Uncharacterized protein n=1 Tax=Devosia albogilva TaxID=429726 RepID=A0ABW5QGD0_9HYPH